jgi:soluble lytic murein transglycosylase-like protein
MVVVQVSQSSRSRSTLWWAACLLASCATGTTTRPSARPAGKAAPATPPASAAAPVEPACEPLPPPPEPLGPLREFTDDEWTRIRRAQRFVQDAARERDLSPSLLNGMIWVESKFEARARGKRGPRGVLQLMPQTARYMAKRLKRKYMPYSIDFNIAAGAEYLTVMLDQFDGDLALALAGYNAGPAVVVAWRKATCPAPKPRQVYVALVERAANAFCERLPRRHEPESSVFTCAPTPAPSVAYASRSKRF